MASDSSTPLSGIFAATTAAMQAELGRIRASLTHPGEKGSAAEEVVARFLNEHMPGGVRATAGQVVDRTGARSGQIDVIIYDATRTPMLFTSAMGHRSAVPAEGVLGVVEVKTKLNPHEVERSIEHVQKVKSLVRDSYFVESERRRYQAYGRTWSTLPVVYSVFAFEGDGLYADILNDPPHHDLPAQHRVDNMVVLGRGVCLAASIDVHHQSASYHPSPTPTSAMVNVETDHALATWFATFMSVIMQAVGGPPINLTTYMMGHLTALPGDAGSGTAAMTALRDDVVDQAAVIVGLPADTLQKFMSRSALTVEEAYTVLRNPAWEPPAGDSADEVRQRRMSELARELPFADWVVAVATLWSGSLGE